MVVKEELEPCLQCMVTVAGAECRTLIVMILVVVFVVGVQIIATIIPVHLAVRLDALSLVLCTLVQHTVEQLLEVSVACGLRFAMIQTTTVTR